MAVEWDLPIITNILLVFIEIYLDLLGLTRTDANAIKTRRHFLREEKFQQRSTIKERHSSGSTEFYWVLRLRNKMVMVKMEPRERERMVELERTLKPVGDEWELDAELLVQFAKLAMRPVEVGALCLQLALHADDVNVKLFRIVALLERHHSSLSRSRGLVFQY